MLALFSLIVKVNVKPGIYRLTLHIRCLELENYLEFSSFFKRS